MRNKIHIFSMIVLSCLSLDSCKGNKKNEDEEFYVNEEITSYVKAFKTDAKKRNIFLASDVTIEFSKGRDSIMSNGVRAVGVCYYNSRKVLIEDYQWNFYNSTARKFLIYHELGHCLIRRKHENSYLTKVNYPLVVNAPASIMHYGMPTRSSENFNVYEFIEKEWNLYADELMYNDLNFVKNLGDLNYVNSNELILRDTESVINSTKNEEEVIYD
jgi:hypothetical protein